MHIQKYITYDLAITLLIILYIHAYVCQKTRLFYNRIIYKTLKLKTILISTYW